MQPQDLLILLLLMIEPEPIQQKDIADRLGISRSAVSYAMARLVSLKLISEDRDKVMRQTVLDFIKYAIAIVFPPELGPQVKGIPTAISDIQSKKSVWEIVKELSDVSHVWKSDNGIAIGQSIKPVYPSVPQIVTNEPDLYAVLMLIDVMRVSNSREKKLAYDLLEKKLIVK